MARRKRPQPGLWMDADDIPPSGQRGEWTGGRLTSVRGQHATGVVLACDQAARQYAMFRKHADTTKLNGPMGIPRTTLLPWLPSPVQPAPLGSAGLRAGAWVPPPAEVGRSCRAVSSGPADPHTPLPPLMLRTNPPLRCIDIKPTRAYAKVPPGPFLHHARPLQPFHTSNALIFLGSGHNECNPGEERLQMVEICKKALLPLFWSTSYHIFPPPVLIYIFLFFFTMSITVAYGISTSFARQRCFFPAP